MDFRDVDHLWLFYYENSKLTEFSNIPMSNEEVIQISQNSAPALNIQGRRFALSPRASLKADLYSVIQMRSSQPSSALMSITFEDLSDLLFCTSGSKKETAEKSALIKRNVPSAGGLYPLELFFFAQAVEGIPEGLYYFDAHQNEIVLVNDQVDYEKVAACYVSDDPIRHKNLIVFFCPVFNKTIFKYHNRGFRFVFMEADHQAQNMLLVATALSLRSIPVCGYFEYKLDELLKLDGYALSCVYTVGVGK